MNCGKLFQMFQEFDLLLETLPSTHPPQKKKKKKRRVSFLLHNTDLSEKYLKSADVKGGEARCGATVELPF